MKYSEMLKSPDWLERRDQIIKMDEGRCTKCGRTKHLQVHHRYYIAYREVWAYPAGALVTLCGACHKKQHSPDHENGPFAMWEQWMGHFIREVGEQKMYDLMWEFIGVCSSPTNTNSIQLIDEFIEVLKQKQEAMRSISFSFDE